LIAAARGWHWLCAACLLGASLGPLSGCVVWDIRNEMRKTNVALGGVQQTMDQTNQRLDRVESGLQRLDTTNSRLESTNASIDSVEKGLGRIDATNTSLSGLEQQLALLKSMNTSMGNLDVHLAALRKTIGRIDNAIPFLDLGTGDAPVEETAPIARVDAAPAEGAPGDGAQADGVQAPAQPSDGSPPNAPTTRRDALVGTWLKAFPDDREAMVLLADGSYVESRVEAAPSGPGIVPAQTITRGTWKREGNGAFRMTPQSSQTVPTGAAGSPAAHGATYTITSFAGRMLAVERDGALVVFTRR
jgi:TolA-binding protein